MGARICPRCSERVDERRAKASPFCLRCGAALAPQAPVATSTFAGKAPGAGGSAALFWVLGGIGLVLLLGLGVVVVLVLVATGSDTPAPVAVVDPDASASQPKIEVPTAAATIDGGLPIPSPKATGGRVTGTGVPPIPTLATTRSSAPVIGPFPRAKAQAEVDRVGSTLASCKRASGPFGGSTIRIDFEPDGRVGTVTRPPFAGTPVGSCISGKFLSIRIGPFQGTTQSIDHGFIIQD